LGANELAVMEPDVLIFLKTETELLLAFATTRSGLPSPSTSQMAVPYGLVPGTKSSLEANELAVMEPELLVFLKTETVLLLIFVTTMSGLPSPSTSQMAKPNELDPDVMSTFEAKDVVSMIRELGNVTINGAFEYAANPVVVSVTEIGAYDVPIGVVTLSEVEVALFTVVFTAPKYTTSFATVVLKFVPVMVTVVPMGPEVGVRDVIVVGVGTAIVVSDWSPPKFVPPLLVATTW
jgi:hypothetical protein